MYIARVVDQQVLPLMARVLQRFGFEGVKVAEVIQLRLGLRQRPPMSISSIYQYDIRDQREKEVLTSTATLDRRLSLSDPILWRFRADGICECVCRREAGSESAMGRGSRDVVGGGSGWLLLV